MPSPTSGKRLLRRTLPLLIGGLMSLFLFSVVSAQVTTLTVTLPASPTGVVVATVNGTTCGTATTSPTAPVTLTLSAACQIPGAAITLTSNGVAVASSLTVPAGGVGALSTASLNPANPVLITVPAVPGGSGSVSAMVGGQVCATVAVSQTATTTLSLPASCAVPNSVISFVAGGSTLASTLTVPAAGGATLTLTSLASATPVVVTVPAGTGSLLISVDGLACGSVALGAEANTVTLPASCAIAGESVTFVTSAGVQLSTVLTVPVAGGAVNLADLSPVILRVNLPAGPAGTVSAIVGGMVCGTATTSPSSTTVLVLTGACSIPGAVVTFVANSVVDLEASLGIPAIISGPLTLTNLTAADPLTVTFPRGTGKVDVMVGANVCGSVVLSATAARNVTLPATCIVPGARITFALNGTAVTPFLTIPTSGSGTLAAPQLVPVQAPTPADTGYGPYESGTSPASPWLMGVGAILGLGLAGGALRRRIR